MIIGVPKEIKTKEFRVGLVPDAVRELVQLGHQVYVEHLAGESIGFSDEMYHAAGASIVATANDVFFNAQLIVKVKEPQPSECLLLKSHHILFTYLHLAAAPTLTQLLCESGATCIAYETVTSPERTLPLLMPMSEVAGRMSVQAGAYFLEKPHGGSGILLGGVAGVERGKVLILGGGVVGSNAALIAMGMGADVWVFDKNIDVLRRLGAHHYQSLHTEYATESKLRAHLKTADLVVGGILIPGAAAPKIVSREMIQTMKAGSVVVDVAIDQGGCFETSHATTHDDPVYVVDGVTHYCVANMPGAVPRTSSLALNNATLPYVIRLANEGLSALKHDAHFMNGLNIYQGKVTHQGVANSLNLEAINIATLL